MNICNNFIFILANNIENKQFIICKNLDPKGDETSNYTEYAIPILEKLINIKYNHIYVDTNVSTNRELNTFNIYIISNNSIFKFTIGDILSDAQHTKFIYNNTYTFKNNFIKLNAKNYCVIRKKF